MAKQKRTNPVILQPGMIIGANGAEMDDEFLLKCFVHYRVGAVGVKLKNGNRVNADRKMTPIGVSVPAPGH